MDLRDFPFPAAGPTGGPEAIFERTSIEIARGCTEGCRFCQAGMIYRPVQERAPEQIIEGVAGSLASTGNDEVALTALSPADVSFIHPLIETLAPKLAAERVSLGISSLRAYGLAPQLLDELKRVRAAGLTFAPEAGTQRLRDVINKNITEEQLQQTADQVFARGFQRIKLYFMLGLPTERDEDLEGIVQTSRDTALIGKRAIGYRAQLTVSVSTHVPKPHTPFQWAGMDSLEEIRRKQELLRSGLGGGRQLKLRMHDPSGSMLEAVMARGDRRLAPVIERAWRRGARFDSWDECADLDRWREALAHFDLDPNAYLAALPVEARLPWSHIDVGLREGFLATEYRRALRDQASPPCAKPAGSLSHPPSPSQAEAETRKLVCYQCGVECDMDQMRAQRLAHLCRLEGPRQEAQRSQPEASTPDSTADGAHGRARPQPPGSDPKAGHRYRFRFLKAGAAALLGHLDLVRELPRIFRRLGEPLMYTGGFHPKPKMALSPALSLGVVGLDEHIDLRLANRFEEAALPQLLERMNAASPTGLDFLEAIALPEGADAVSKEIVAARCLLGFAPEQVTAVAPEAHAPLSWLAQRCQEVLATDHVVVRRKRKKGIREVDIRAFIRTVEVASGETDELLRRAGMPKDLLWIDALVSLSNEGSVRLPELAALLLGLPIGGADGPPPYRAVRAALLCDDGAGLISPIKAAEQN